MKGCFILIAVCLLAVPARGQPASDSNAVAREVYKQGERLAAERRFAEAFVQFEAGYKLSLRPMFLFNMAECARQLGQPERARTFYLQYLAEDPNGSLATTARERLASV